MATIVFGGGISQAVGSHGGSTFATNKAGAYSKARIKGTNPDTHSQGVARALLVLLSKYWSNTLTDAERSAWDAFAATYPTTNRVGATIFLSGQQAFVKLNAQTYSSTATIYASPPVTTNVGTPNVLTITATSGSPGTLALELTANFPTANDKAWFWVSPPLNPGRAYVSSLLRRLSSTWILGALVDVTAEYSAQYGQTPTAAGQRVIVRAQVVNTTTGVVSSSLQGSALWA